MSILCRPAYSYSYKRAHTEGKGSARFSRSPNVDLTGRLTDDTAAAAAAEVAKSMPAQPHAHINSSTKTGTSYKHGRGGCMSKPPYPSRNIAVVSRLSSFY